MNQSSKQGGKKTKRKRKGGRKRKLAKKEVEIISSLRISKTEAYDVTFSDLFINDINNDKMSKRMTNVLFEKMPAHQEGY